MSSQPPRRRRRRRPQSESESDSPLPRRRKKKSGTSGKKKRKKSANHAALLKIALIASIGIVLLGGLFMVDWNEIGGALGLPRSPEQLLNRMQEYQDQQLELIASLEDKDQAKAAVPQLNEIAKELARLSFEFDQVFKTQNRTSEEFLTFKFKYNEQNRKHEARLQDEIKQLRQKSGLGYYVNNLLTNSQTIGRRYRDELRLNQAKKGASDYGYSPVSAGTPLSQGMRIQGIGSFYEWQDCIVREIYQDGTVRVNFQNGGPSLFDKKIERDRLRIPDGSVQVNSVSPVNPERVDGNFRRVEPSRPKRVPTGREF
ncbi:hypothetical protein Enr10x_39270 [Gimesia panareensis]|uniref:Uncharacterized protein n=1 Tax=Gimesia panareensis TaxID=2527978 RepID=A0A517QAD3_9PLAN|nr:hypothetical protein [Gimesia panareensis]QDT28583.1 hypothetical protein Enr10x_39270 [Gimesia panareensis]